MVWCQHEAAAGQVFCALPIALGDRREHRPEEKDDDSQRSCLRPPMHVPSLYPREPPIRTLSTRVYRMQATVETYQAASGAGTMLTDTGQRIEFAQAAIDNGKLRHVRPGQRVYVDLDASGTVAAIRIF